MNKNITILLCLFFFSIHCIYAKNIKISDISFLKTLIEQGVDSNNDGQIQLSEIKSVTQLELDDNTIHSINEIYLFENLSYLSIINTQIKKLDLNNPKLEFILCEDNHNLKNINIYQSSLLEQIFCQNNPKLQKLKIEECPILTRLICQNNLLKKLILKGEFKNLKILNCTNNIFKKLDISFLTELLEFYCRKSPNLKYIYVHSLNKVTIFYHKPKTTKWIEK